jgi:adenylate kinase family enzyme
MEFKGTKKFNVNYHTTMNLPYKYTISNIQETIEESCANALLISKAPEMLEMLEIFESYFVGKQIDEYEYQLKLDLKQLIKEATEI